MLSFLLQVQGSFYDLAFSNKQRATCTHLFLKKPKPIKTLHIAYTIPPLDITPGKDDRGNKPHVTNSSQVT